MIRVDVVVVGGGIVGLATARAISRAWPASRVVVLEREAAVGQHQSSHNSGVVHAGVYYTPGSIKARLCRRGKDLMERFCADHEIPLKRNGKLVVAVDRSELPRFDALVTRAEANGVDGLTILDAEGLRAVEPHVVGLRALHSPTTGVVDFGQVCTALAADLDVRTGVTVTSVDSGGDEVIGTTSAGGEFRARAAVVCAGLQAEDLARRSGHAAEVRIVPFRGSWTALHPSGAALVRANIYPVPDPGLPFLGVHFTRRVDDQVWAGPNAVPATREWRLLVRAAAFRGSWHLAAAHLAVGAREVWTERNRRAALAGMRRYLPELTAADVAWGTRPFGIRAQAVDRRGRLVDDFVLATDRRVVHVLNAPSPAATSSLGIGEHLAGEVASMIGWGG